VFLLVLGLVGEFACFVLIFMFSCVYELVLDENIYIYLWFLFLFKLILC
jgi:hypothetical protein